MPSIAALDRRCFLKPAALSTQAADPRWFRNERSAVAPAMARDGGERALQERKATPAAA